jgi:hypothetical protein
MHRTKLCLILALITATFSLSLPAVAADKISGVNKDFQRLSETSVTVPDKPGHTFKQNTVIWKTISSDPRFGEAWTSAVAQQDNIGPETTERAYGTNHYPSGDVSYFSFEGVGKTTKKDGGDFEVAGEGKFTFLGGTGKFKNLKGSGTYTCKFTPKGGQCDWDAEVEM